MAAFKEGVWWENQISRQMSSVGSDFLIKAVLFDDSDNALHEAFKTLCDFLILHHFPLRETMENTLKTEDTDFIYIQPLQLFEGFEPSKSDSTPF